MENEFDDIVGYCSYCKNIVEFNEEYTIKRHKLYHKFCYNQKFNKRDELNFDR